MLRIKARGEKNVRLAQNKSMLTVQRCTAVSLSRQRKCKRRALIICHGAALFGERTLRSVKLVLKARPTKHARELVLCVEDCEPCILSQSFSFLLL